MIKKILVPAASLAVVLIFWQTACLVSGIPDYVLPSPLGVAGVLFGEASLWVPQLVPTLVLTAVGFTLSLAAALGLGLVLDQVPLLERFLRPILVFTQTIPAFFLYPILLIALGFGFLPLLVVVIIACFFPILVTFLQGLRSCDPQLVDLMRSLGASRWKTIRWVKLPSARPALFSGVRLTATYALSVCVMGEYMGAQEGLGVYMARAFKSFAPARVLAAVVVVSLFSLLLNQAVVVLERHTIKGVKS